LEIREFQTRIGVLTRELEDKNREIEQVTKEKQLISETAERALQPDTDLKDQTSEITALNDRYRKALKDKVSVYDELVKAVKSLAQRNSEFMANEIDICRLLNVTSVTQKELDQKEKLVQELTEKINSSDVGDHIQQVADLKLEEKKSMIQDMNNQIYEKDKKIE
jgi:hypothetical protein